MWITQVMAVISVIERVLPLVEKLIPGRGQGQAKKEIVQEAAKGTAAATLPQVNMEHPDLKAALDRKIAADVEYANLLQAHAEQAGSQRVARGEDAPPQPTQRP